MVPCPKIYRRNLKNERKVKLLLDTQCWLWWHADSARLGPAAKSLISDSDNSIYLSVASIWEIAIKFSIGKLDLPEPPKNFVLTRLSEDDITPVPITALHAAEVATLPHLHRDPFDRLIIAQAMAMSYPIMTSDSQFNRYAIQVISAEA